MFKVGDWVIEKSTVEIKQIKIMPGDDEESKLALYERLCVKWHPKEGEWCWFDKNKLGKFWKKQGTRNYWTLSDFVSISEKTKIPSGDYFVSDYCEPFIGQLPSFIKD